MEARTARQREEATIMALAFNDPPQIEKLLRPRKRVRSAPKWWGRKDGR